ncbi:TetR/AcrR family transcriptional regulator [Paenibacillus nasutitermitis]|uniref:TetR family transcriptional regulator n=1 Tax=Paenibacillus nasutitermitis TaxID=1652958 RepID=A0A916YJI1_9BACL|nr:TetR/AcrR family transcriptional regulator [Paenibacillus nasutitermitis]GGD48790.1 TetR family transcriptional regulator [Paenibacillus nasutitermitis]
MDREMKKEQTRLRIKDAAYALFSELGYEATTVEQVAKLAGVAKGTFFNYFSSKDDLIHELQGIFVMTEVAKLKDKPGPLIPRLRMVIFQMVQQFPHNKSLIRALFQAELGGGRALEMHNCIVEDLLEGIVPIIVLGQESGELRKDMPAIMIGQLALQTYFGALFMWSMDSGDEPIDEQMALTFDLFFKGIAN